MKFKNRREEMRCHDNGGLCRSRGNYEAELGTEIVVGIIAEC